MAAPNPFQNLVIGLGPGERIFSEGEIGTTMFIVQVGRVRLFRSTPSGTVVMAEMEKGDFFGEMSLLEAVPRNMSAEAVEATELIEINSTTFDRMIRSNIEVAVRMLRKLSGRLQKAETLLGSIRSAPAGDEAATEVSTSTPAIASRLIAHTPEVEPEPVGALASFNTPAGSLPAAAARRASASAPAGSGNEARAASPAAAPIPAAPARSFASTARPAPERPPAPSPASTPQGSLSATRPPSPLMQAQRPVTSRAAQPRLTLSKPVEGQGPRLVSESGETIFPVVSGEALVGRYDPVTETQPEVDLTLIDIKRSVSRRHARVTSKDGTFFLTEEVGALNGTFINGTRLVTGSPAPLKDQDRVSLGTVNLIFRV